MRTVGKILLFGAGYILTAAAAAAVPVSMSHSGRLLSSDGSALSGEFIVSVTLYEALAGGPPVWNQTSEVRCDDGYYNLVLGEDPQNPLDGSILGLDSLYLGIAVGGHGELVPRSPLHSVPYASVAGSAAVAESVLWENVASVPATLADGELSWTEITGIPAGFSDGVDADTTYSAGEGLLLNSASFTVNTEVIQSRVTADCPAGQAIQSIAVDGTVTCSRPVSATSCGTESVGVMRYGSCGLQICDGNAWQGTTEPYTGGSYDYTSSTNQSTLPSPWELHWDDDGQVANVGIGHHVGSGLFVQSTTAPYQRVLARPTCVEAADVQALLETANMSYNSFFLRAQGDTYVGHGGYQLEFWQGGSGAVKLHVLEDAYGSYNGRSQLASIPCDCSGPMRVRYEVKGDHIRARWWSSSDPEPSTWGIDVVDTTIQGTGFFGPSTYTNYLVRWGKIAWSVTDEEAAF